MRISEIITESSVNEAISVSEYEGVITKSAYKAIWRAIGSLHHLKGEFKAAERAFDKENSDATKLKEALAKKLNLYLGSFVLHDMRKTLNNEYGSELVKTAVFTKFSGTWGGSAHDQEISMSAKYLHKIRDTILNTLVDATHSSYSPDEYVDGLYFFIKAIEHGDAHTIGFIEDRIDKTVKSMIRTFIHEVVHVEQHVKQKHRKDGDTEYRSYLDRKKGEFSALHDKDDELADQSPQDQERYWQLYVSSPQEIAAFSHEAAIDVIRAYGYDTATTPQELDLSNLETSDIIDAIDKRLHKRFTVNPTKKESSVRKRYYKLVYQEIVSYVHRRLARMSGKI